MLSDLAVATSQGHPQRVLCRADDHSRFAYRRVNDFYRESDHALWAHLEGPWLLSVRSGSALAYEAGGVFLDAVTNEPVYVYERGDEIPAPQLGCNVTDLP